MPVLLSLLDRVRLMKLDKGPAPLLDLVASGVSPALAIALDLDIFSALHGSPATLDELSQRLDHDPGGLAMILNLLETGGYVDVRRERFHLTEMSETWVQPASSKSLAPTIRFWDRVMLPFIRENLEQTVRHGTPQRSIHGWIEGDTERQRIVREFYAELTERIAPNLVEDIELPQGSQRMLTLGVQWAYYPLEFSRAYPNLSTRVVEYPTQMQLLEEIVEASGLADRLTLQEGDYLEDPMGEAYHIVVVGDALSRHPPKEAQHLLQRASDALQVGGRLIVVDRFPGIGRTGADDAMLSLIGLIFRSTYAGQVHPHTDVTRWLEDMGLRVRKTLPVGGTLGLGAIVADRVKR